MAKGQGTKTLIKSKKLPVSLGDPSSSIPITPTAPIQKRAPLARKRISRAETYIKYLQACRPIVTEIKEHNDKGWFDPNETQKCKEIYRKVLSKLDIACDCGKTITGSEISRLFSDVASASEKEIIDIKGKKAAVFVNIEKMKAEQVNEQYISKE